MLYSIVALPSHNVHLFSTVRLPNPILSCTALFYGFLTLCFLLLFLWKWKYCIVYVVRFSMGQGLGHKEHRCADHWGRNINIIGQEFVCMLCMRNTILCGKLAHEGDINMTRNTIQYNTGHQYDQDHYTGHQYDHTLGNTHPPITQSVMWPFMKEYLGK